MFANWVRETTTTTGTGDLTVSAVSGYLTFNTAIGQINRFYYSILDDSTGAPIETGIGRMSASTTLVREKILATLVSGTYDETSPAAVTLAAGTKRVVCSGVAHGIQPALPFVGNGAGRKNVSNGCFSVGQTINGYTAGDTSGRLNAWPWEHMYGGEVDAFEVNVTTAQSAKILRIGLYAVKTDGNPGALIVESASMSLASAGMVAGTFSARVIPPGWYFVALLSDATTALLGGVGVASAAITKPTPWGTDGSYVGFGGYALGVSTSAMPDPCPAMAGVTSGLTLAQVYMRCV